MQTRTLITHTIENYMLPSNLDIFAMVETSHEAKTLSPLLLHHHQVITFWTMQDHLNKTQPAGLGTVHFFIVKNYV